MLLEHAKKYNHHKSAQKIFDTVRLHSINFKTFRKKERKKERKKNVLSNHFKTNLVKEKYFPKEWVENNPRNMTSKC